MTRSGTYKKNLSGDMTYKSFVPAILPPNPTIELDKDMIDILVKANKPPAMQGEGTFFIVGDAYNDEGEKIEVSLSAEQLAKFASDFCYPLVDISDNAVAEEPEESEALDFSQT